jgi:hypothetical protein
LVGKREGKRPLGRPGSKWEDNTEIHLEELKFEDVDWIDLAQVRDRWRALVNMLVNLQVP